MVIDLFAGAGGWDVALQELGFDHVLGFEVDKHACATRDAAGHWTARYDLTGPSLKFDNVVGLCASPPCPDFSTAGKRKGILGKSGWLVYVPMLWVHKLRPRWIAFEQVPGVLPYWLECVKELEAMGYSAWAGYLQAEQYGVPQTRKRAILMASRDCDVAPPAPTHSRYYSRDPLRFDLDVAPWISMAEALGWGTKYRPGPTVLGGGTDGEERDPAHGGWTSLRPATTVAGDERIGGVGDYRKRHRQDGGVRVTVEEASILQSFRPDYPWQGPRSRQFQQIGNAIPPGLAQAVLQRLTRWHELA